ncbi:lysyl oxidase homolog 2B-like [Gymnodraco acuticeps]|uniref:Lysyl oxidase homolog 2B-like n=1 Tax=Gymnodraco acuticeps TaxID=8218 RepID=A0A6P8V353_GYMAC|nr:lysyl oxidase homolog 2B-like [Gymnodraco acuticeps]
MDIQVEDVRIRAILSSYRKRIPMTEGYVEVKDGGKWKQICNTEWSPLNARVICGMFGFPGERKYNGQGLQDVCAPQEALVLGLRCELHWERGAPLQL